MQKLTEGERRVWEAASQLQRPYLPSYEEIAEKAGVTRTTVATAIDRLVEMGYAERDSYRRRSVFLKRLAPRKRRTASGPKAAE